jgi:hypothetical protein
MTEVLKIERDGIKRTLNTQQRLRLLNLAKETFVDNALFEAEQKALDAVGAYVQEQIAKMVTEDQMKAIKEVGLTSTIDRMSIDAPWSGARRLLNKKDTRTFVKPNGDEVVRDQNSYVSVPRIRLSHISFDKIHEAIGYPESKEHIFSALKFSKALILPIGNYLRIKIHSEKEDGIVSLNYNSECSLNFTWQNDEVYNLILTFFLAADARYQKEASLFCAIRDVIIGAKYFADIVEIWPEANKIVDDLFPIKTVSGQGLIALNEEKKKLLCENMTARGVKSPICEVA